MGKTHKPEWKPKSLGFLNPLWTHSSDIRACPGPTSYRFHTTSHCLQLGIVPTTHEIGVHSQTSQQWFLHAFDILARTVIVWHLVDLAECVTSFLLPSECHPLLQLSRQLKCSCLLRGVRSLPVKDHEYICFCSSCVCECVCVHVHGYQCLCMFMWTSQKEVGCPAPSLSSSLCHRDGSFTEPGNQQSQRAS